MSIQEMNDTMNNYVKPSEIMNNIKDFGKDMAAFSTVEADLMMDRGGDMIETLISKVGNTSNQLFKGFVDTAVDGIIRVMDKKKELNNVSFMNKKIGLNPRNQYPRQMINQQGGNNESEFMKYVYTEKPIWFTKKDMIWN
jgi:hypothetical protein